MSSAYLSAAPVGLFQQCAALLQLGSEGVGTALGGAQLFPKVVPEALLLLQLGLGLDDLRLVPPDRLLRLGVSLMGKKAESVDWLFYAWALAYR